MKSFILRCNFFSTIACGVASSGKFRSFYWLGSLSLVQQNELIFSLPVSMGLTGRIKDSDLTCRFRTHMLCNPHVQSTQNELINLWDNSLVLSHIKDSFKMNDTQQTASKFQNGYPAINNSDSNYNNNVHLFWIQIITHTAAIHLISVFFVFVNIQYPQSARAISNGTHIWKDNNFMTCL